MGLIERKHRNSPFTIRGYVHKGQSGSISNAHAPTPESPAKPPRAVLIIVPFTTQIKAARRIPSIVNEEGDDDEAAAADRPHLLPVVAVLALGCLVGGASATVVTTCRAAADSDASVDYGFCVAELGKHRDSPDADVWGLAKVAALTGVINAAYDINALLLAKTTDGPTRAALEECGKLYVSVGLAFAEADDEINGRRYAAGKDKVAEAVPLARQCDDALARAAAVPSPLAQHSSYNARIANICTAITNLIK